MRHVTIASINLYGNWKALGEKPVLEGDRNLVAGHPAPAADLKREARFGRFARVAHPDGMLRAPWDSFAQHLRLRICRVDRFLPGYLGLYAGIDIRFPIEQQNRGDEISWVTRKMCTLSLSSAPDSSLKKELGLDGAGVVVTFRPPATEAHYHNPEAEVLMDVALNMLVERQDVRIVLLPRNKKQEFVLRKLWGKEWIDSGKIVIPPKVVDGLNLIWLSDLVISGGGTMNREAAALGIPVYSIFRGKIGAVDRYLASTGRMVLLESVEDVRTKIKIKPRAEGSLDTQEQSPALQAILEGIVSIVEHQRLPAHV